MKHGGSISAEHGRRRDGKRDLLPSVKDPVAIELMRSLKRIARPERNPQSLRQGALNRRLALNGALTLFAGKTPGGRKIRLRRTLR